MNITLLPNALLKQAVILAASFFLTFASAAFAASDEPKWPSGFDPEACERRLSEQTLGQFKQLTLKGKIRRVHEMAELIYTTKDSEYAPPLGLRLKDLAEADPKKVSRYADELVIIGVKLGSFAPSSVRLPREAVQNICGFIEFVLRQIQGDSSQNEYAAVLWGSLAQLRLAKLGESPDPYHDFGQSAAAIGHAIMLGENDVAIFPLLFAIRMLGEHASRFSSSQIELIDEVFFKAMADIDKNLHLLMSAETSAREFKTLSSMMDVIAEVLPFAKPLVKTHERLEQIMARVPGASRN